MPCRAADTCWVLFCGTVSKGVVRWGRGTHPVHPSMLRSTRQTRIRTGEDPWLGRPAGRWLFALAMAWGVICTGVQAQTPLRYGGDIGFAPFESLDANGQPEGFQVELMQAVGRELGVPVSINLQKWPATVEAFKAGRVDVIAMVETTERRAWATVNKQSGGGERAGARLRHGPWSSRPNGPMRPARPRR